MGIENGFCTGGGEALSLHAVLVASVDLAETTFPEDPRRTKHRLVLRQQGR